MARGLRRGGGGAERREWEGVMVSKKCDQCWAVKRCQAYPSAHPQETGRLVYLCRSCARLLGYVDVNSSRQAPLIKGG